jgi:hypothetical protein
VAAGSDPPLTHHPELLRIDVGRLTEASSPALPTILFLL